MRLCIAIRARREALGISQEEFAQQIAINHAYYGDDERGKRNLTLHNLARIAEGLTVSTLVLFKEAEALIDKTEVAMRHKWRNLH